jgi:Zn-finger nucleic acid-binding protein
MPLLLCPNCRTGMRQVERNGVKFEVCPECHGVWLDGGELEALLAERERSGSAEPRPYREGEARPYREGDTRSYGSQEPGKYKDRDDDWDDDYDRRTGKRRSVFSRILDALD